MANFLLGTNGRLLLVGGVPLRFGNDTIPTSTISLTPWYVVVNSGYTTRFSIQTTASSNDTTGDVPVVFSYTGGTSSSIYARVVDSNNNPVVDWLDISKSVAVNTATNTGLGYITNVPAGIGYKRQIKIGAGGTAQTDTVSFNIGTMILPWGQSNMTGTMDGNLNGNSLIPGTSTSEGTYFNNNGTAALFGPGGFVNGNNNNTTIASFNTFSGGALSLLRIAGSALQNKFGKKVGIALNPWDQNATPMSGFMTSSGVISMLANTGTSGSAIGFSSPAQIISGDYRIVAWHQGESDTLSPTRAGRLADLKKFCQAHINQVAKFGRKPSQITFLFALMGVCAPQTNGSVSAPQMELLRAAVLDLVAYSKTVGWDVRVGWNCIDLDPATVGDGLGLHFGGADKTRSVRRLTQSILNVLDPVNVPYGASGPYLTGEAVRVVGTDDVILTVAHNSGSARQLAAKVPGSSITGWYANTSSDFSGVDIPITNVTIVDSTHIKVTAVGYGSTTFYLKHCGYQWGSTYTLNSYHPDVSNLIYDDFSYPTGAVAGDQFTGLPLQPTPDAIKVI